MWNPLTNSKSSDRPARDEPTYRLVLGIGLAGSTLPFLVFLLGVPYGHSNVVYGIASSAAYALPMMILSVFLSVISSVLVLLFARSTRIELRGPAFGAATGAIVGFVCSIPCFLDTTLYFNTIIPTLIGMYFQTAGRRFSQRCLSNEATETWPQIKLWQLMMSIAWIAVFVAIFRFVIPPQLYVLLSLGCWLAGQLIVCSLAKYHSAKTKKARAVKQRHRTNG